MFRPIEFMEQCRKRYGPVFSIQLGAAGGIVVVGDPAHAMDVLAGDREIYDSGQANLLFRPVLGPNSLLVLDGEEHMEHRRIRGDRARRARPDLWLADGRGLPSGAGDAGDHLRGDLTGGLR